MNTVFPYTSPSTVSIIRTHVLSMAGITQVGSPAVRLRLAGCTAWVKRWSEAMDFLQTIFKINIFLLPIFENYVQNLWHIRACIKITN